MIQHQSIVLSSSNLSQRLAVSSVVVHVYLIVSGEAIPTELYPFQSVKANFNFQYMWERKKIRDALCIYPLISNVFIFS